MDLIFVLSERCNVTLEFNLLGFLVRLLLLLFNKIFLRQMSEEIEGSMTLCRKTRGGKSCLLT